MATPVTSKPATKKRAESSAAAVNSSPRSEPGADPGLRADLAEQGTIPKSTSKTIKPVAYGDEQPNKLPDDLDAMEAEILRKQQQLGLDSPSTARPQPVARHGRNGSPKSADATLDTAVQNAIDQSSQAIPPANNQDDDVQNFPSGPESRLENQIRALNRYKAEQQGLHNGVDGKSAVPVDSAAGAPSSDPFATDSNDFTSSD